MKHRGYWTRERCIETVSRYKTKKDLYTNDKSAYVTITRNKWFDIIDHLEVSKNDLFKRLIYSYEFEDKYFYVGLTYNINNRNKQHMNRGSVSEHIGKTGLIPKLIIKTDMVSIEESIRLEEVILNEYISKGWFVLNKAKTGSTGGFSSLNLDKLINEIKKYEKLSDFIKMSPKYYWYITRHSLIENNDTIKDLIDNIRTFNKIGKFKDKENCEKESLKYKTRTEFQLGSKTAWNYSRKNNWLDEFYPKLN
jgi:predicted GIY-YIG superfamily endonuclease